MVWKSTVIAYEEVRDLENSFHQRGVRQALQSSDPLVSDAVSIELGFSTMTGGSELQMTARRNGQAFELRATEKLKELGAHASIAALNSPGRISSSVFRGILTLMYVSMSSSGDRFNA